MSGSNGRCSTSERGETPLPYRDGPVEGDGFITIIATGWKRSGDKAQDPKSDPETHAVPDPG